MKQKNKIWISPLVLMGLFLMLTYSCNKDDNSELIELTTSSESNVTLNTAICGGNITSDGGSTITARGVCWSTNNTPTISDSKSTDGSGTGGFTSNIAGLIPNTTYYVRAYATNSDGTSYGNAISFKTQKAGVATVTDIDGNIYHTVEIGTQVWMVENLNVTKYRNGASIPNISDETTWSLHFSGAYCHQGNIPSNGTTYGKLYNWYAVNDSRNICPTGWHVPTDAEWSTLMSYLGGEIVAGGKLKETGTTHWTSPNTGATNESGFKALPGGTRNSVGPFSGTGSTCYFWSSTEDGNDNAWYRYIRYDTEYVQRYKNDYCTGYSVRCILD